MSVVNQMLKDLEDRKADDALQSAVYQPTNNSKKTLWLIFVIAALVMLVAILGWFIYSGYFVTQDRSAEGQTPPLTAQVTRMNSDEKASQKGQIADFETATESNQPPENSRVNVENNSEVTVSTESRIDINSMAEDLSEQSDNQHSQSAMSESTLASQVQASVIDEQSQPAAAVIEINRTPAMSVQKSSDPSVSNGKTDFSIQASGRQSTGVSLREQALAALRAGQDALAIQLLTKLIQLEPSNIAASKKLAAVLYSQNQSTRSITVLEDGIRVSPQDADLRLMLARLLTQKNESNRALSVITPDVSLVGKNSEFLGFRAALAEQLGSHEIAHEDYLQLSDEQPNESRWWLGLAVSSERIDSRQVAIQAYQRVIVLNQLDSEVISFAQQRINQLARIQ